MAKQIKMTRMPLPLHTGATENSDLPLPLLPGTRDYTLKPTRIDIWQYRLDHPWHDAFLLLNTAEQHRAQRYHFERHRRRFSIARATLRTVLSHYIDCDARDILFEENAYGKPYVANAPWLQFNLSHSRDMALLAVGHTHELGIDLEFFAARALIGISQLMFSETEVNGFTQVATHHRSLSFFHIWAQKEAFIKACGMGLSYPLQSFSVPHLPPTRGALLYDTVYHNTWKIHTFMPEPACCAALCYHPDVTEIHYHVLWKEDHAFTR